MNSDDVDDQIVTLEMLKQRAMLPDLDELEIDDGEVSPSEEGRINKWAEALLIGILSSLIASAIWWMSSQTVLLAT